MSLKGRLERLEDTRSPAKQPYTGAKELLWVRFYRSEPETKTRLLAAIRERLTRAAE